MGWLDGAMVLGKLPMPGRPIIWMIVGQGPIAVAVGAGGAVLTVLFSSILSSSLWETARYRLKYCLKGPLSPKQPTNQRQGNICKSIYIARRQQSPTSLNTGEHRHTSSSAISSSVSHTVVPRSAVGSCQWSRV